MKMLHKILVSVDSSTVNKSVAVILEMVNWSQAFDRQSHRLGIKSFIDNRVRPSLIPILMSFFQDRKMQVKWKGILSNVGTLPGGGPQGGTLGIEEYLSQSNNSTDFIDPKEKFKFIDDLSVLKVVNLISIGLASYNCRSHVPSDIGIDNSYLDKTNIKSPQYLNNISDWTSKQEMKLNSDKTKYMIFNFSRNYQFYTRLNIDGQILEQVHETKLLGLLLRDYLSWIDIKESIQQNDYFEEPKQFQCPSRRLD
jgi:hypothetical protein